MKKNLHAAEVADQYKDFEQDPILRKPTKLIIPGPVLEWMREQGITILDVVEMLERSDKK